MSARTNNQRHDAGPQNSNTRAIGDRLRGPTIAIVNICRNLLDRRSSASWSDSGFQHTFEFRLPVGVAKKTESSEVYCSQIFSVLLRARGRRDDNGRHIYSSPSQMPDHFPVGPV